MIQKAGNMLIKVQILQNLRGNMACASGKGTWMVWRDNSKAVVELLQIPKCYMFKRKFGETNCKLFESS